MRTTRTHLRRPPARLVRNAPKTTRSTKGEGDTAPRPSTYQLSARGSRKLGSLQEYRAAKQTINAMYEIDPARNGGVDFQYDEVVRNKDLRRKMHASDCECCHDVGALSFLRPPSSSHRAPPPTVLRGGRAAPQPAASTLVEVSPNLAV